METFEIIEHDFDSQVDKICPFCGAESIQEKCKVICRSEICTYRIIYNCSEF